MNSYKSKSLLVLSMDWLGILNVKDRRVATGAYSAIQRNPGDAIRSECDLVAFAIARIYHAPSPGWIPAYQSTAVNLARRIEAMLKHLT